MAPCRYTFPDSHAFLRVIAGYVQSVAYLRAGDDHTSCMPLNIRSKRGGGNVAVRIPPRSSEDQTGLWPAWSCRCRLLPTCGHLMYKIGARPSESSTLSLSMIVITNLLANILTTLPRVRLSCLLLYWSRRLVFFFLLSIFFLLLFFYVG